MRVYLDACCLNRLTDDQGQSRIRQEANAVELILRRVQQGEIRWLSSEALKDEIGRSPNLERRLENAALLSLAAETVGIDDAIVGLATELEGAGYGAYDALHLACAEAALADVLLTTDDGFIRKASRGDGKPLVAVRNPLSWGGEHQS